MNAVGIDLSKGKSMMAALRPMGEVVLKPREYTHDEVPLAELVLRIITGKPDLVITDCQTQKDMKRLAGARSICLDAYGKEYARLSLEEV